MTTIVPIKNTSVFIVKLHLRNVDNARRQLARTFFLSTVICYLFLDANLNQRQFWEISDWRSNCLARLSNCIGGIFKTHLTLSYSVSKKYYLYEWYTIRISKTIFSFPSQYIYIVDSKSLFKLQLIHLISFLLVLAEIEYTMHAALPKRPINQFNLVQQSIQQSLRTSV